MTMIKVWDRVQEKFYLEQQYGESSLHFLYQTRLGQFLLPISTFRLASRLATMFDYLPLSKKKIFPFVQKYKINLVDYETSTYQNFADFFERKIKPGVRPIAQAPTALIAPADSKLLVLKLKAGHKITIKNQNYFLSELLRDDDLAARYQDGLALIFRLTIDDFHHFCFIDNGRVLISREIKGKLHNVGPIGQATRRVWAENYRRLHILRLQNFGDVVALEIGALLVGKIINYPVVTFVKGQAKGYFALGGSTIMLIISPHTIKLDSDIVKYNRLGYEVKVKLGEKIGTRC